MTPDVGRGSVSSGRNARFAEGGAEFRWRRTGDRFWCVADYQRRYG
ncbi:hypothetical protein F750_0112 [Streptomyces sp. PAMC 26508]|nr:hypothetical protein F750_0112 [Streptomyces sp. PAMC 26508]